MVDMGNCNVSSKCWCQILSYKQDTGFEVYSCEDATAKDEDDKNIHAVAPSYVGESTDSNVYVKKRTFL